jgi:hypothetical protein
MDISNLIFDNIDIIIEKLKIVRKEPGEKPRFSKLSDEERMVSYPHKAKIAGSLVSISAVNFDEVKKDYCLVEGKNDFLFDDYYFAVLKPVVVRERAFCSDVYETKTCGKNLALNMFNCDVLKCGSVVYFKMKVKGFGNVFIRFKVEPTYNEVPVVDLDELVTA